MRGRRERERRLCFLKEKGRVGATATADTQSKTLRVRKNQRAHQDALRGGDEDKVDELRRRPQEVVGRQGGGQLVPRHRQGSAPGLALHQRHARVEEREARGRHQGLVEGHLGERSRDRGVADAGGQDDGLFGRLKGRGGEGEKGATVVVRLFEVLRRKMSKLCHLQRSTTPTDATQHNTHNHPTKQQPATAITLSSQANQQCPSGVPTIAE